MTLRSTPRYDGDRTDRVGEHAVVVGASMAGLFAARVLSDGFDRVTVLDRDSLPDEPVARRGVPQASHPHVLLEAGRATIEDLLPGYCKDVLSNGGLLIDAASELDYYDEGGFVADGPTRLPMYCASRPLFEQIARRRVAVLDGVTLRTGCGVTDYLVDDGSASPSDGTTVTGVAVRERGGGGAGGENVDGEDADGEANVTENADENVISDDSQDDNETELGAELVVDATGRTSRTPTWLADHGYPRPPADEVHIDLAYSTAVIDRPPGDRRAILAPPSAPRKRGGGLVPVEGDRWLVNLHGMHGDHPPTDREGLTEFAASLPVSELREIASEHPWAIETVEHYPFPSNVRRRYEALDRFPDGLLVVGDAIASFNPIYGQGMSVAALEALLLHHALAEGGRENLPRRFFDRAESVVDLAWRTAVGGDFAFPETVGPKPRGTDLSNWYLSRLLRAAHADGELTDAFYRVLRLEQSPTYLFRPSVLRRVFSPTG